MELSAYSQLIVLLLHALIADCMKVWQTLYMDDEIYCGSVIHNDDMEEHDIYLVKSDQDGGRGQHWLRRPAECGIGFNFGDRLVGVLIKDWRCDDIHRDLFLAIYDDCEGRRNNLLGWYNCTSPRPTAPLLSPSFCVSLYHYRGHTDDGYYFSLHIVARQELMSFPAGSIAAIIISSIVVLMIIVKVICVISGFESRLPDIDFDADEHKSILVESSLHEPIIHVQEAQDLQANDTAVEAGASCYDNKPGRSLSVPTGPEHVQLHHHRILGVARSTGSGSFGSGAEMSSDYEYDFLDVPLELPTTPRLKRYPSAKASSLWRH